jgi:predicted permease
MASVQAALYPRTNGGRSAGLRPLQDVMSGSRREPLFLLAGAATLLLVLCCANVAGLMLARWTARSREIAVRIALGSDFLSLAQCFLAESAVLSAAGTACGLAAAMAVLRIVPAFVPGGAVQGPLQLDRDAFAFALALALAVAFLIALGPAFALRRADLSGALKGGGRRWRGVLAAAQVALSVVLLLSAGALLRSFVHLMAVKPGFEAANALRFGIGIPEKRYDTDERVIGFHRNLLDRLRALPGVDSAGAGQYLPLTGDIGIGGSFQITGANTPRPQWPRAWHNVVSPGYFRALGIPLFQGRDFSWLDDHPGGARVAIVNQALVRANFPGRPALGAMLDINYGVAASWQIVGIVGDARQSTLDREAVPQIYLSMTQLPADGARYVVRGRVDPRTVAAAVAQQDPRLERVNVEPLELTVERSVGPRAATLRLVAGFGAIALLLTVTGLYGILTSRAAERSREMAIRMALGATGAQTGGLMVAEALRLAVCGIAAGLVAFCLLYGVSATDPVAMGGVALLVIAVSLAASFAPSRRAARTQPIDLLRDH